MASLAELGKKPLLVIGRAGMDFYADPPGTQVEHAQRFVATMGGSSGNIAVGLVKLGLHVQLVTSVSDDAVGRFVRNELSRYGVDLRHVTTVSGEARTSLAVTETRIENTQNTIYRNGAADFAMDLDQVDAVDFSAAGGVVVTGTALAAEPSRSATLAALAHARDAGIPAVLDIDYRPYSWPSGEEAAAVYQMAAALCDTVVGNDEEFAVMAGEPDGAPFAEQLAQQGRVVVYKMGEKGSLTFAEGARMATGIFSVNALKPMGAGDAFMAAFLAGLAEGRGLPEAVERGSAAAALVVSRIGCAPAMPTREDLDAFIAKAGPVGAFNNRPARRTATQQLEGDDAKP
ncbi:MAG: 5-dehydro-2-deoxygluconokinase [Pseudomonadota bacterium]